MIRETPRGPHEASNHLHEDCDRFFVRIAWHGVGTNRSLLDVVTLTALSFPSE